MKFQQTVEKSAEIGEGINYDKILDLIISISTNLAMALAILVIGFWVVKKAMKVLKLSLEKSSLSPEITIFLSSLLSIVMKVFILLAAIGQVGVDTASLVGLIAAAGFAVGMALQGSLANFAAGIMIMVFKPYKLGDWIETCEKFGKVESIQIFNTTIVTPGQKVHIIPNGQVMDGVITNFSQKGTIRLELNVTMPYAENFPRVQGIIKDALLTVPSILNDPEPEIGIETYDSHNVVLTIRPFIDPNNYWGATYQCHAAIKKAFHENGVQVAYSEGVELGEIGG